jgi:DNA polymerase I
MKDLMEQKDHYKAEGLVIESKSKKLLMNSGYGAFGYVNFQFYDPRVCELITGFTRYILKELVKVLDSDPSSQVVYGDTDSLFVKGDGNIDIVTEAKNRFGVRFELDKAWKILFLIKEKKQYFGLTTDGKLIHKTLVGMKNDRGRYFNSLTANIISKSRLEHFIAEPDIALKDIIEYVKSSFHLLQRKIAEHDIEFIETELAYSSLAKKPLYKG